MPAADPDLKGRIHPSRTAGNLPEDRMNTTIPLPARPGTAAAPAGPEPADTSGPRRAGAVPEPHPGGPRRRGGVSEATGSILVRVAGGAHRTPAVHLRAGPASRRPWRRMMWLPSWSGYPLRLRTAPARLEATVPGSGGTPLRCHGPGPRMAAEPVMSLSAREQQALASITDRLARSDPQLASLLGAFSRHASGEEMPGAEDPAGLATGHLAAAPPAAAPAPRRSAPARRAGQAAPGFRAGRGAGVVPASCHIDRSRAGP